MKKVELQDVKAYDVPGHFKMVALKLHGREETNCQGFWIELSHFLPGGGADFGHPPCDKVYFVLDGEVTVKSDTEEFALKKWDSIYIAPLEGREIINKTNQPASMLVIYSYPA